MSKATLKKTKKSNRMNKHGEIVYLNSYWKLFVQINKKKSKKRVR